MGTIKKILQVLFISLALISNAWAMKPAMIVALEETPTFVPVDGKEIELLENEEYAFCGVKIGDAIEKAYPTIVSRCAGGYPFLVEITDMKGEKRLPLKQAQLLIVQDAPCFEIEDAKIHAVYIPAYLYEPWANLPSNYTKKDLQKALPDAIRKYTGAHFSAKTDSNMLVFRRGNYFVTSNPMGDIIINK